MRKNYPTIMEHTFQWEGGYVDHPQDPGGATNMGITFSVLREWRGQPITKQDVRNLTREEAIDIYKAKYWNKVWGDIMPSGLDLVMMDAGVNSGIFASIRWVQRALGNVNKDGKLGPQTYGAIQKQPNMVEFVEKCVTERLKSVRQFRNYAVFGRGWENRIASVLHRATELAKNG